MWRILCVPLGILGSTFIQLLFVLLVSASVLEKVQCTRASQPVCRRCQHVSHRRVLTDGNFAKSAHPGSEIPGRSR
ncbi:uncharacterized protein BT62DRAFT_278255 [Guyanagaster necrorhizus]|uniref:Secreted protein n=1 Tax=Guyanagaster necrorhizus TaxID=856835 RepID=A0A9P8AYB2_9AGAR|nr:uncharacterized protein BT62DRAFT_278255 [Guyanagaster necrorhizus MCA 3950]KAG7452046.1 hypothetical protein BT62DRAFT_278255 [Guyanagaster necrorhizus MCA 3950]